VAIKSSESRKKEEQDLLHWKLKNKNKLSKKKERKNSAASSNKTRTLKYGNQRRIARDVEIL
jgi:hypothetical protein